MKKVYRINENVRIEEYDDKSFARWQVIVVIDGKVIDSVSTVFNDFYDALIYVGIYCKGVEANRTNSLFGFVTELIEVNKSRFKNTRITKKVYDKLQKIND